MYDLVIVGAGPAGLACSVYASRFRVGHLVVGRVLGGTITEASEVGNYPGFISVAGLALGQRFVEHARAYGAEIVEAEVLGIKKSGSAFKVAAADGVVYGAKTIFLGLGTKVRRLGVPGEARFLGKGVSYCAVCDAPLFGGGAVVVVGGGNSAATAALHLAEFAKGVYLVHRGEELSAEPIWQEKVFANPKIKTIFKTNITEIGGEKVVQSVALDNGEELAVKGVFIEIGVVPAVDLVKGLGLEFEEGGLIKIKPDGSTNVPGVWAGGDIASAMRGVEPRQVVTAVSEGAQAAISIYKFLKRGKSNETEG